MIAEYLSNKLSIVLGLLGRLIARFPWPFLLMPVVISVGLAYVLYHAQEISTAANALQLYVPKQGISLTGREAIISTFGDVWESEMDPINGVVFTMIVSRRDGGDILNAQFISEYLRLRAQLEAIVIEVPPAFNSFAPSGAESDAWKWTHLYKLHLHDGPLTYQQLCLQNRYLPGTCVPDFMRLVTLRSPDAFRDIQLMTFPSTTIQPLGNATPPIEIKVPLGGVNTTRLGYIRGARAAVMYFVFSYSFMPLAQVWERAFQIQLKQFHSPIIRVSSFTLRQFIDDLGKVAVILKQLVPSLILVLTVFCVVSFCVVDWVHSKPVLAIGGVVSACLAIVSGFGLTVLCGTPTVDIVYVAPFLMLSVGVDDMFLMLASWRKTTASLSLADRMHTTFTDAAVGITITSVTDLLSFIIGIFTIYPAVRYFCIYTTVSIVFIYIYQITMFGAMMAWDGRREMANRHCLLPIKIETSAQAETKGRSMLYKVLCTGGDAAAYNDAIYATSSSLDGTHTRPPRSARACLPNIAPNDNVFNIFFQRYYAPILRLKSTQVLTAVSYVAYICGAIYGVTTMQIGMNYVNLLPDDTITTDYLIDYSNYLARTFSPPMEVMLPPTDLSREQNQHAAIQIIQEFENTQFTTRAKCWLYDFLPFYERQYRGEDFYVMLNNFVQIPYYASQYAMHIKYDPRTRTVTSRCLVGTQNLDFGQERLFLTMVSSLLDQPLMSNVSVYHPTFQLGEQQTNVLPNILQSTATATVVMLIVSFLLIPRAFCSLCLAVCIISTNLGVLGYMSLWGVRLDIISMITLLMSEGISVDYVAHISYHYVHAMQMDVPLSKAQRALRELGLPIMQGAMATLSGMAVLMAVRAYLVQAFVKTLFLVVLFGLYHGLLILPIVLSLFLRDHRHKEAEMQKAAAKAAAQLEHQKNGGSNDLIKKVPIPIITMKTALEDLSQQGGVAYQKRDKLRRALFSKKIVDLVDSGATTESTPMPSSAEEVESRSSTGGRTTPAADAVVVEQPLPLMSKVVTGSKSRQKDNSAGGKKPARTPKVWATPDSLYAQTILQLPDVIEQHRSRASRCEAEYASKKYHRCKPMLSSKLSISSHPAPTSPPPPIPPPPPPPKSGKPVSMPPNAAALDSSSCSSSGDQQPAAYACSAPLPPKLPHRTVRHTDKVVHWLRHSSKEVAKMPPICIEDVRQIHNKNLRFMTDV